MKKIMVISSIALLIAACGGSDKDKNASVLKELKKQEAELKVKIAKLEEELNAGKDESLKKVTSVSVSVIKPHVFKNYIDIQGKVDAEENISLSSQIPGIVTKINVIVGDKVKRGEVLAETDDRAINEQISDLQNSLDMATQVYEKQKSLWDLKIGTEIQFLQAKTNKISLEKKMAALKEQLRMTKIISPINGVVDAVDARLGQVTSPGIPSIRVINFSKLKVKADVAESYASKIKKGSDVIVRFPDMNDSIVSKVSFVSRSISPVTRTFSVEVILNDNKEYYPNMIANLSINDYQSKTPVVIVPVKLMQKDENNASFVFIAIGNKVKKQLITVGKQYRGLAEITAGLKEGDILLQNGYDLVNDGETIEYKK